MIGLHVIDHASDDSAQVVGTLRELLALAEAGEIHSLIAIFKRRGGDMSSRFSGTDDILERFGMVAMAQADLTLLRHRESEVIDIPKVPHE